MTPSCKLAPGTAAYYNSARTHLSLNKDAPLPRVAQAVGRILPTPILGGLHHQYIRRQLGIWFFFLIC